MEQGRDDLEGRILKLIRRQKEPLETKEIMNQLGGTRSMVFRRLLNLKADGHVQGKYFKGAKAWVWWLPKVTRSYQRTGTLRPSKKVVGR